MAEAVKKDLKKSMTSYTVEQKETLTIKDNDVIKDRTNNYMSQSYTQRRGSENIGIETYQRVKRDSSVESKKEIVLNQRTF